MNLQNGALELLHALPVQPCPRRVEGSGLLVQPFPRKTNVSLVYESARRLQTAGFTALGYETFFSSSLLLSSLELSDTQVYEP